MRFTLVSLLLATSPAAYRPTPPAPRAAVRLAASSSPSLKLPTPVEALERLASEEARQLQRELLDLALEQDPQVVFRRSLDLARAIQTVGTETLGGITTSAAPEPPVILRRMCEELGATYVKLGQFIASSPTLFPPEYVQEFQKCLDSTPPMPWSDVKPLVEAELGKPLGAVYASVEEAPLAAASIGQVHVATLYSGERVIVKVIYPEIRRYMAADLINLKQAADFITGVLKMPLKVCGALCPETASRLSRGSLSSREAMARVV